jgi:selenocysteine lyase/cysteine desulfurase
MTDKTYPEPIYFNNAGQARLHPDVATAGISAIQDPFSTNSTNVPRIRECFAQLIQARSQDIALMPSTAFAITFAAHNLATKQKSWSGRIIILQDQYDSAVYPWQDLCHNNPITLDIVPYPHPHTCTTWTSLILERITKPSSSPVAAVCIPPLHWAQGGSIDLVQIGQLCRNKHIPLIVDATQAVGAISIRIPDIQPWILACSTHKWLRGPHGASLVYVDPQLHDTWEPMDKHSRGRDLAPDWNSHPNPMGPHGYPETYYSDARKFDSGGKSNPILMPMICAALERVRTLDPNKIQCQLQNLMQPFLDWVEHSSAFDLASSSANVYHIIGIRPRFMSFSQMMEACQRFQVEKKIYLAVRAGLFRISPYIDNSSNDVQILIQAFQEMEEMYTVRNTQIH